MPVKAAVLERSRRSTAGKRMSSLVGKAQEDDDAFWSHSIWSEGGGGFSKRRREDGDGDDNSSPSPSSSGSSDDDSESSTFSDGEGSFRMSDEESDAAVDQFDSDFDESESEDEEEGGDGETERELIAEERRQKASQKKNRQQVSFQGKGSRSGGGRELIGKKKKGAMTKRGPTGEGWNAGLVLNWPVPSGEMGQAMTQLATAQLIAPISGPAKVASEISSSPLPQQPPSKLEHTAVKQPPPTAAAASKTTQQTSPVATKTKSKITAAKSTDSTQHYLRAGTPTKQAAAKVTQQQRLAAVIEKKITSDKPRFTQEELIIEAIKSTEMENSKWLSARKRVKEEEAHLENAMTKAKTITHNPVSRFHSRRGCNNTLTFMDMDHLPDILTRSHPPRKMSVGDSSAIIRSPRKRRADSAASHGSSSSPDIIEKEQTKCVITGKVARYRDPKTMMGYYDLDAFKELRRRLGAGELPKNEKKKNVVSTTTTKKSTKRNTSHSGDESTMIAKLASAGVGVKVKVKVGNVLVPPPLAEGKEKKSMTTKKEKEATNRQSKQRWDDASDNMYAKSYSTLKKLRRSSSTRSLNSSQQLDQPKSSSTAASDPFTSSSPCKESEDTSSICKEREIDTTSKCKESAQQNGNQASSKDVSLQPTSISSATLPLPSPAKGSVAEQTVDAAMSSNGESPSNKNKLNIELKPTPSELNTFLQTWISRPENKNNWKPSLQQKQWIMEEIGVDKRRLEGWFYRARKKQKVEHPTEVDTTPTPQMTLISEVGEAPRSNPDLKVAEGDIKEKDNEEKDIEEKDIESSQNHQHSFQSKNISVTSSGEGNEVNPNAKSTSLDDKNDAIPFLPNNGNKKCEQPLDMISKQSEIPT